MSQVSSRILCQVLKEARGRGIPIESICAGLELDGAFEGSRNPVSWEVFASLLDRLGPAIGGQREWESLSFGMTPIVVRPLVPVWIESPYCLFLLGVHWLGPMMFRCARGTIRRVSRGRYFETIRLRAGCRHSTPFFHLMSGVLQAAPTIIGLPPATVQVRVSQGFAEYEIDCREKETAADSSSDDDLEHIVEFLDSVAPFSTEATWPTTTGGVGSGGPLIETVRCSIAQSIEFGESSEQGIATNLGLSCRTLKRRLRELGTSFRQERIAVLRAMALAHLQQGESVEETAESLGFSERAAFSRAFKRWTGTTPGSKRIKSNGTGIAL